MMEADSVHALLEGKFKHHSIYGPSDYVCLMRTARIQQPYEVEQLSYNFFQKYDGLPTNLSSIRPGKLFSLISIINAVGFHVCSVFQIIDALSIMLEIP